MDAKLTLSVNQNLVSGIKEYLKQRGMSVSGYVEDVFSFTLGKTKIHQEEIKIHPKIEKMFIQGRKPMKDFDEKKALEEILTDKYLNNG